MKTSKIDSMIKYAYNIKVKALRLLEEENFIAIKKEAEILSSLWDNHYFFFKSLFRQCQNKAHAEALEALFNQTHSGYSLIYLRLILMAERDMFHRLNMHDKEDEINDKISDIRHQQAQAFEDAEALRQSEEVH